LAEFLEFRGVSKRFGAVQAVDGVSLEIKKGEFFSLLGPSGCGKTTMLRLAAGFEEPDAGRVFLDGRDITDLPPDKRKVNTIFQSYALFPHMTVRDNIAFGLTIAKRPKAEIRDEVDRMLELIRMADQAAKKPDQLSGGQKQRVAVARALVNKPDVLLLDEPLAALDLKLRQRMLIELDLIHDQVGITFLYVTHDQAEAMSLSDRIAVMDGGRVEQVGAPAEIYESPRTSFVAAFIGDTNFLEGRVEACPDREYCRLAIAGLPGIHCFNDKSLQPGQPIFLSIRPEKIHISRASSRTSSTSAPTRNTGSGPAATGSRSSASTPAISSTRNPSAGRTRPGSGGTPTTASCSTTSGKRTRTCWPCRRKASASRSSRWIANIAAAPSG
jgi:spermidine/putrescine transport system ATP-binding protein